ncbi:MAG: hypothetical protein HFI86_08420 [Bacilli bacterium]|nr:hypothetical protein [Bacilli bacterium]
MTRILINIAIIFVFGKLNKLESIIIVIIRGKITKNVTKNIVNISLYDLLDLNMHNKIINVINIMTGTIVNIDILLSDELLEKFQFDELLEEPLDEPPLS